MGIRECGRYGTEEPMPNRAVNLRRESLPANVIDSLTNFLQRSLP